MNNEQSESPILKMCNITKRFSGVAALDKVDLTLRKGEVLILVGENGAGKSTLMKILAGVYQVDEGEIWLHGQKTTITSPSHAKELGISIIFQELALFPDLTVAENVFIGRELKVPGLHFLDQSGMKEYTRKMLQELDPGIAPSSRVRDLRIGQQQVVEIARALKDNSSILILDEPTSALEDNERNLLFQHIRTLSRAGVSIVYVSHRLQECMEIGDRIMVLRDGNNVNDIPVPETSVDQIVEMMVGHSLKEFFPKRDVPIGEKLLEVSDFTRKKKYRNVSFYLRSGEILGLAGLPDSGKNELAGALFGAQRYDSGQIWMGGKLINITDPASAMQAGIAFLPSDRKSDGLFLNHAVKMNITIANLREITHGFLRLDREREISARYESDLTIKAASSEQYTRNLSGGNQQKVMLARWLCTKPRILILNEPTRGIDVGAKVDVFSHITQFVQNGGAVIMVSSELPELVGMCDRTIVMHEGVIVAEMERSATTEQSLAQYQVQKLDEVKNGIK